MVPFRFHPGQSVLIVVDIQPAFMAAIHEAERVREHSAFIISIANLLNIPVLATEQYAARMGGTDEEILRVLPEGCKPIDKMRFSCCGAPGFMEALGATFRRQVVLVGIETHICVSQTALDLLERGFHVAVCPDAVSARTLERHKLGMERLRDSGVMPAHTESVAYEWLGTAEHPKFRDALKIVKELT